MDWIKIKNSDLDNVLSKPQLAVLKAAALSTPGRDAAAEAISSAIARIRAEIAASGVNTLDVDHSKIPRELKDCALVLAVEILAARLGDFKISDALSKRADEARATLLRIADGSLPVSRPLFGIAGARPKGFEYGRGSKAATSKSLEGL